MVIKYDTIIHMPDTPYCPLLSIQKEVPVLCQEELCMWYVKQLKLCAITVQAYANAINIQASPPTPSPSQKASSVKQTLNKEPKKEEPKVNPFALDDLE